MASKQQRPVATFDHLRKKKPIEITKYIPLDDDSQAAYEAAKEELERARLIAEPGRLEKAEVALAEARRRAQEDSIRCVFRAMGRERYKALVDRHPPTTAMVDEAKENRQAVPEFNPETLAPQLISASMIEPRLTPEEVQALILPVDEVTEENGIAGLGWTEAEYGELFNASLLVNNSSRITDYSF